MARTQFHVGMLVCENPDANPYWARGLVRGEVKEVSHRGNTDSILVKILETTNPRLHIIGRTLWMGAETLNPIVQTMPCKLNFVWR